MNLNLNNVPLLWDEEQSPESLALLAEDAKDAPGAQLVVAMQIHNTKPNGIHDTKAVICLLAFLIWKQACIDGMACKEIIDGMSLENESQDVIDDVAWAYSYDPGKVNVIHSDLAIAALKQFVSQVAISHADQQSLNVQIKDIKRRFS